MFWRAAFGTFGLLLIFGCSNPVVNEDDLLLGAWLETGREDSVTTFARAKALKGQCYGLEFLADGTLIERSFGWCATPPLSYSNTEGRWARLSDGVIEMTTPTWLGDTPHPEEIVELTEASLALRRLEE